MNKLKYTQGKYILVTGGAIRAGAYLCRLLAAGGAKIIIHCRNSFNEAEKLAAGLPGQGHRVLCADFALPGEAAIFSKISAVRTVEGKKKKKS